MTLTQLINIAKARYVVLLAIFLTVLSLAIAFALFSPRKYTASAVLVVDVKATDPLGANQLSSLMVSSATYVATQIDVLSSERVSKRGAERLLQTSNPELKQILASSRFKNNVDTIASVLQNTLKVTPSPESSVVTVSVIDSNQLFAAEAANAIVQGYTDINAELRMGPAKETSEYLQVKAREARARMESAQARLVEYQQNNQLIATDEKLDVENQRLASLSSQLVTAQSTAFESTSRGAQAGRSGASLTEALNNPVIATLKSELSIQRSKLSEMLTRLGDAHPQVIQTRATISQIESRLVDETNKVSGSVLAQSATSNTKVAELEKAVDDQRKLLLLLNAKRAEAEVLSRDVDNARLAYDAISERLNRATVESQSSQTNVHVLKMANVPRTPSSPKIPLLIALGGALGALLAAGTVLIWELLDRRFRSTTDVTQILRLPVLGVMPSQDDANSSGAGFKARVLGFKNHSSNRHKGYPDSMFNGDSRLLGQ